MAFLFFLAIAIGLIGGLSSSLFLILLDYVTDLRFQYPTFVFLLPVAGIMITLLYQQLADVRSDSASVIAEFSNPSARSLPWLLAPLVLIGTLLTHLMGGSAGREGTAVQISAVLADQLRRFKRLPAFDSQIVIGCGVAAGFSGAIGVGVAGGLFAVEVFKGSRAVKYRMFPFVVIAALVAQRLRSLVLSEHAHFLTGALDWSQLSAQWILSLVAVGILSGSVAALYLEFMRQGSKVLKGTPSIKIAVIGGLIALSFAVFESFQYAGLGLVEIEKSLLIPPQWFVAPVKLIYTIATLSAGFKGGEFIPMVFIGTALGSWLSAALAVPTSLLAPLGFGALFGAVSKTPLSCALMTAEIFGWSYLPASLLTCLLAASCNRRGSIYQKLSL